MKRFALAALALAVILVIPASAQTGIPVKNALVVVSGQDDAILQSMLAAGGSPSSVLKALKTAEGLLSAMAPSVPTDEAGRFELDAPLSPGTYNVTVFAPGFVASSDSIAVDGDGAGKNLTIFMQPSAMVSGRVTDEQGRPVSGIVVAASSPHSANYDITMDDGVFVLDTGLKAGLHDIYAFKPGVDVARLQALLNSTGLGMLENKVPALFKAGDAGYVAHASAVQLEQGKLTTLNVQLESSHAISGRVTDGAGNPVSGVAVFAFGVGSMADTAAITDSEGRYVLNNDLAPGMYTIVIPSLFSKGYAPASSAVTVPAENAVDFALDMSGTISGRVVDAGDNPVAGAKIFAISNDLDLDDTQLAQFLAAGMATAKTDQDGRFALGSGIGNGTYIVTASFGSVPASSSIEVEAGSPADIALDFKETITVKGKVADGAGRPIEGAFVVPSFASAIPGAELFAARTGPGGEYELTIPLKGNSTKPLFDEVTASADGYRSATARSNATVELEAMPASKITGVVIAQKPLSPPVETVLTRKGTVVFEHEGAQYEVGLQTNARVLGATFDPPGKSISVNLEGVQNAAGRSEFSIPREFMSGPFAVSLDGRPAEEASTTENQTHATIAIDHEHDLKEITIQAATAVPELPLPAALAAAGMAAALAWKRLRR
ncbi:MAG TPA: carboxypeptidase-like regulatory domain-containing protein [Nitrososphaera sp.]|nr:carboxypeptidase-like regulatory domain-containing protein [Nitrososphaera sp.]